MAVFFLLFYGLNYYATSISHAMPDLVLFTFMLIALRVDVLRIKEHTFGWLMSGFGVLTAFFDILSGSIPIGAALAILMIGIRVRSAKEFGHANIRIVSSLVLFGGSLTITLLLKQLIAAILFPGDDVIGTFVQKLLLRTTGPVPGSGDKVSLLAMYNDLFHQIYLLTFGSTKLGVSVFVISVFLLIFAGYVIVTRGSRVERYRLGVVLLANAVFPIWFMIFTEHTMVHPMYLVRVLVITMASGWVSALITLGALRYRS
jgi:hypothetical protein